MDSLANNLGSLLPPPPVEPPPSDCCHNDCCTCVFDIYQQALRRHHTAVRQLQMQQGQPVHGTVHSSIVLEFIHNHTSESPANQLTTSPPPPLPSPPSPLQMVVASLTSGGSSVLTESAPDRGLDVRRVLMLELAIPPDCSYEPGDYVVVRPPNDETVVRALIRR